MLKKTFLVFLLFTLPLNLLAEHSFEARLGGLKDTNNLIPKLSNTKASPLFAFHVYLPGIGRTKIILNQNRDFKTLATFTKIKKEIRIDQNKHRLLRGRVIMKSKQHPLAASVIYLKKKPYLILNFSAKHPRITKSRFYKIKINLAEKNIKKARIYRLSKLSSGLLNKDQLIVAPNKMISENLSSHIERSLSLTKKLDLQTISLNIDADAYWYQIYGEDSNSVIFSFLNEAENIYQSELGINFRIVRQNVFVEQNFGSNNAVDRLCNYQHFTAGVSSLTSSGCQKIAPAGPQEYFGNANAYHLFTGQELSTSTIGLAFVGTICRHPEYAFALTQLTSAATTPITFVHELAHNLSAIHDHSSGFNGVSAAYCPATKQPHIMNPYLSLDPPETFSACSRNLITEYLEEFGHCLNQDYFESNNPIQAPTPKNLIDLKFKVDKAGKLKGEILLPSFPNLKSSNNCNLYLRFSKKKTHLPSTRSQISFPVTQPKFELTMRSRATIKPIKNNLASKIFLKSELRCENELVAESKILSFRPHIHKESKSTRIKQVIKKLLKNLSVY